MFRASILMTIFAGAIFSAPAHAQVPAAAPGKQVAVHYADLDLTRHDGAAALIVRIEAAAAQACGPAPDIRELSRSDLYRKCIADGVARGVAAVDAPMVTELYHDGAGPGLIIARR